MSDQSTGRMLLSHNFNLNNNELPALNREEFAQVFIEGFPEQKNIQCSYIQNPHWVVEIKFPLDKFAPQEIGQMCGEILTNKRQNQLGSELTTDTLILGGKKTTPVTSASPTSLQTGQWGVDVVETAQAESFLAAINWDTMTADKPSDGIFKIEFIRS
ncbi:MAG: DUF2656 domain-containing protein [Cyanobacteria bacterium P01_G01_bin.39]